MSSTNESVRYVRENLGDDPSEATSRRLGSPLPSYVGCRRWSLRQAAYRLLDESFEEEEDVGEEEERSSLGEMDSKVWFGMTTERWLILRPKCLKEPGQGSRDRPGKINTTEVIKLKPQ
ncbi:UNVERIFIED_CONTAM: hypothetical protein Sradi_7151500 [Sesamum radiatum]|uniref:Uncharacterized protein n=1 Tax=Sesamum radiatum TaxID=300843 RepID=A0AAW2IWU9_SESRA